MTYFGFKIDFSSKMLNLRSSSIFLAFYAEYKIASYHLEIEDVYPKVLFFFKKNLSILFFLILFSCEFLRRGDRGLFEELSDNIQLLHRNFLRFLG